jgi:RimJ/RimL family protein N-acetyltransferase
MAYERQCNSMAILSLLRALMAWLEPVVLQGSRVQLEPLSLQHHDELVAAVKDGELWKLWYTSIPAPELMRTEIERRLRLQTAGSMLPFAVRQRPSDKVVGMTTYLNVEESHRHVEIGATWYSRSVQRTGLNTQCKFLLLSHAFDRLQCIAVEFRTHFFNHQSRRAIERLGAKLDGILRNHQIGTDDSLRDTCVYSIIAGEWPAVKLNLLAQL